MIDNLNIFDDILTNLLKKSPSIMISRGFENAIVAIWHCSEWQTWTGQMSQLFCQAQLDFRSDRDMNLTFIIKSPTVLQWRSLCITLSDRQVSFSQAPHKIITHKNKNKQILDLNISKIVPSNKNQTFPLKISHCATVALWVTDRQAKGASRFLRLPTTVG